MTQAIYFNIISNYIFGSNFNGQTSLSPAYIMKLVMHKLKPAERNTLFGPP